MDFQILLSPADDFEGDIVLLLSVRPSFLFTCLLPLTKWESCQLLAKILGKYWLWHPGRNGLKVLIMALNPIQIKNKKVTDNRNIL